MESKGEGAAARPAAEAVRVAGMPVGRTTTTLVASEQTGGAYSLFEVEVSPGGGEGPHVQHREDKCLYVVGGRFAFVVEGAETEAGPGAHLYVRKGLMHRYTNVGARTGRILVLITPGGPHEQFLAEAGVPVAAGGGIPPPTQRLDAAAFAAVAARHGIEICDANG
jgi:mannose-6-phosphate isomerase-like protein (cupin superfamily)